MKPRKCHSYLLGMKQLLVSPVPELIDNTGLQVDEDRPGDMLPGPGLVEEGGEAVVSGAGSIHGHCAVGLQAWKFNCKI